MFRLKCPKISEGTENSNTDILFFWRVYTNITGHDAYNNKQLIQTIFRKASRIKRHDDKKISQKPVQSKK